MDFFSTFFYVFGSTIIYRGWIVDAIVCDVRLQWCVLSEGRCHKYFFFNSVLISTFNYDV